jgi:RNA polymerase sigma-70 factor (ECF subfamily)
MTGTAVTEQAWNQIHDPVLQYLRRRVGDEHLAEDLAQEVFLRVHRSLSSLNSKERLHAWVFRIARNLAIDHLRARAVLPMQEVNAEQAIEAPEADRDLNAVAASWLPTLIKDLPEKYQEPLRLSELEGLSQKEVAHRLGLSLSGAKSRIQRGRTLLKERLAACCVLHLDRRGGVRDYERNQKDCNCSDPLNGGAPTDCG